MKKRFLGYVLTALLLLTMLPTAALAVEEPISIGEKGYETLQNALDAIGPGEEGTITVNEDISVDEALTIGERKSVAIVPGAETVKVSFGKDGALTVEAGAKLTLGSEAGTSELVLDGGADWPYTSPAGQSSLWESLYVSAEVQNNGVKRTSPLITASGTLEMYAGVTL